MKDCDVTFFTMFLHYFSKPINFCADNVISQYCHNQSSLCLTRAGRWYKIATHRKKSNVHPINTARTIRHHKSFISIMLSLMNKRVATETLNRRKLHAYPMRAMHITKANKPVKPGKAAFYISSAQP